MLHLAKKEKKEKKEEEVVSKLCRFYFLVLMVRKHETFKLPLAFHRGLQNWFQEFVKK